MSSVSRAHKACVRSDATQVSIDTQTACGGVNINGTTRTFDRCKLVAPNLWMHWTAGSCIALRCCVRQASASVRSRHVSGASQLEMAAVATTDGYIAYGTSANGLYVPACAWQRRQTMERDLRRRAGCAHQKNFSAMIACHCCTILRMSPASWTFVGRLNALGQPIFEEYFMPSRTASTFVSRHLPRTLSPCLPLMCNTVSNLLVGSCCAGQHCNECVLCHWVL